MEKNYQIKVGHPVILNKVGFFVVILGVLLALIVFLTLFMNSYVPSELKMAYYFEIIRQHMVLSLIISVVSVIIGFQLSDLRTYTNSTFIVQIDQLAFYKNEELIALPKWQIRRIIRRKNWFQKTAKVRIKTTIGKEYDLKIEPLVLQHLKSLFPYKVK